MNISADELRDCAHLLRVVQPFIHDKLPLQYFCSIKTLTRYLRARHGNVEKAGKMLLETLHWRHEERMHEIKWQEVKASAVTGKTFRVPPLSSEGRPVLHLRPRHETTVDDQAGNVRHFAYQMEMTTRLADRVSPDGKIMCIIDYTEFTMAKNPPLATTRKVLKILQSHNPERLHEAVLWHPPSLFAVIWRMVQPFVDAVTKKKMVFLEKKDPQAQAKLAARVDVTNLDRCLGGAKEDSFDFAQYGATMEAEELQYQQELEAFGKQLAAIEAGVLLQPAVDGYLPMPGLTGKPRPLQAEELEAALAIKPSPQASLAAVSV